MNIAIIDDQNEYREIIKKEVLNSYPDAKIKLFETINKEIYKREFDLIFLDVLLKNGESFEAGEKIISLHPYTILVYISSSDHFVYKSYRHSSFFFIRKNSLKKDFIDFIGKYEQIQERKNNILTVKYYNKEVTILLSEIIYIESNKNQIQIYTTHLTYKVYQTLTQTYKNINQENFYKFNAHTIINLDYIADIGLKKLCMSNNYQIEYTRNSKNKLIEAYQSYRRLKLWNGY